MCGLLWINNALNSVGMDQTNQLQSAFTDNGPLINRVENPQRINQKKRFNHIRYWYVIESCNEHEELRFIRLEYIASKLNPSDQYTKILDQKDEVHPLVKQTHKPAPHAVRYVCVLMPAQTSLFLSAAYLRACGRATDVT